MQRVGPPWPDSGQQGPTGRASWLVVMSDPGPVRVTGSREGGVRAALASARSWVSRPGSQLTVLRSEAARGLPRPHRCGRSHLLAGGSVQCWSRRARGRGWSGSTEEVAWRARAGPLVQVGLSSELPGHKFSSHPGVPPGRLIVIQHNLKHHQLY